MKANQQFSEANFVNIQNKLRHEPYQTKCWMPTINSGMNPQSTISNPVNELIAYLPLPIPLDDESLQEPFTWFLFLYERNTY